MTQVLQLLRLGPELLHRIAALRSLYKEVKTRVLSRFKCEGAGGALS